MDPNIPLTKPPQKIALIEDEQMIRDLYKRQLNLAGLQIDAFATGKEGLDAVLKGGYALLLLDIMLPDINGLEILKQLKAGEKSKLMPIIILTNLGQDAVIKEGFQLGAEGYILKSAYTPDQIITEVKNVLQKAAGAPPPVVPTG